MTAPVVADLRGVKDGDARYDAILVWCPGCEYADPEDGHPRGGLHMLPVDRGGTGSDTPRPTWGCNGELHNVTLTPSIKTEFTRWDGSVATPCVCHSFLTDGVWHFLGDCTHDLANHQIPMCPLPDWVLKEGQ